MTTDLNLKALQRAYENELPEEGCIFHSDRGSPYSIAEFQDLLQEYGLRWLNEPSSAMLGQCSC